MKSLSPVGEEVRDREGVIRGSSSSLLGILLMRIGIGMRVEEVDEDREGLEVDEVARTAYLKENIEDLDFS